MQPVAQLLGGQRLMLDDMQNTLACRVAQRFKLLSGMDAQFCWQRRHSNWHILWKEYIAFVSL
jgi:hypothetical protein